MNKFKNLSFEKIKICFDDNSIQFTSNLDNNTHFNRINTIDTSEKDDLTFFHNNKYLHLLKSTKAKACLIKKEYSNYLNEKCEPIIVNDPYLAYAFLTNLISPIDKSNGKVHENVIISNHSKIGENVQINANVIIKDNCIINNNVLIYENSVIGPNVTIGGNTNIMPNCTISHSEIGKNCTIQSGTVIGGKGFGFTPEQKVDVQHIGNVKIGDNVDIGSNTTIDRATINSTIIGDNCRIDNLVQIAHNVTIGNNTIIVSQTGISGSTKIGSNCILGGQAGLSGHLTIGNNVQIGAKSGVIKSFADNSIIAGFPARDIKIWKKSLARIYKDLK
tara:strand:- start:161 stop:1156 length:996 start_codon:yes stop_codon:yes gene_type:complete